MKYWTFLILLILHVNSNAQVTQEDSAYFQNSAIQIRQWFVDMDKANNGRVKETYNDSILQKFSEILQKPESFAFPFDTIQRTGKVLSTDGKVRFLTWNISFMPGAHEYFGFIQFSDKDDYRLHEMNDNPILKTTINHEGMKLENWFGGLVYEVIHKKFRNNEFYTLIVMDYNDILSNIKFLDVMYYDENNSLRFGKHVFYTGDKKQCRVFYEYSSQAIMSLKYEAGEDMIVLDHLSPIEPQLKGNYKFYGPDFIYDAFRFEKGEWVYYHDVDITNQ